MAARDQREDRDIAKIHPKVVQQRLGHSTIATTMDIYSHVLREMDVVAAEAFERQFDDVGAQFGARKRRTCL